MVALENSDIKIWRNCELVFINCADDLNGTVQSVEILRSPEEEDSEDEDGVARKKSATPAQPENLKLACFCFIGAFKPECSVDVFTAVNDSGLVYDGGVVVDNNFRTVDPAIYAVGDISRFSRLFRDVLPHNQ